jgi:hypothetical protein
VLVVAVLTNPNPMFAVAKLVVVGVSTGGSLDRLVKLSLCVPAQMGWREMEHKGGEPQLVLSCAQGGCACSRGYKRSRGRERERACSSARPPARPPSRMRALALPFIDARRGSRCTMGV